VGDECLARVASCIAGSFDRATDLVARYGGEEFVVVISHTNQAEIALMAARVHSAIARMDAVFGRDIDTGGVTVSIGGVGRHPTPELGAEELIRMADTACYCAKEAGRNRVFLYPESADAPAEARGE
jgi:diguanylate cyclase (GGDEF)-like protein